MSSLRETDSIVFHWVNPIPRGEDFGIIAEPYFDVDFDEVFYLTDTGRSWNNSSSSVRDRVESGFDIPIQNTSHLIALAEQNTLPRQVMINTHPQRWTDKPLPWVKELGWQNIKNLAKKFIVSRKGAKKGKKTGGRYAQKSHKILILNL